jgi:hypothetical protein
MEFKARKHNTPIGTLLKWFLDKKGGKVRQSRNEILWRFDALDWRYQKQILFSFLQSGKTDREWAYRKLYSCWDNCFMPIVIVHWEKYRDASLARLIIQYGSKDYLKNNLENLSLGRNYYYIFLRLSDDKDFVVDKSRLNETDLLAVKRHLGEVVTDGDILDLFFLLIYKLCKGIYKFRVLKPIVESEYGTTLVIFETPLVKGMLNEIINGFGKQYLASELKTWMWKALYSFRLDYGEDSTVANEELNRQYIKWACYKNLDKEYVDAWSPIDPRNQQAFLAYIEERHRQRLEDEVRYNGKKSDIENEIIKSQVPIELIDKLDLVIEDVE